MNPSIMDSTSTSVRAIVFRSKAEVLTLYSCDPEAGLSPDEVASRRRSHGYNELEEDEKEPMLTKFLSQLKEPLILLLFGSALVSLLLQQ